MKLNNKKGISLIVLVITIIVMIILAAAIILSLQSSGIIGKANEAKTASDVSNAKQVVAMAKAEWQLDEAKIRTANPEMTTFKKYAESKLKEVGYIIGTDEGAIEVTEEGNIYIFPKIPDGFVASNLTNEDEVSEGLVIYEGAESVKDDPDAATTRNQFVWIPVNDIREFKVKDWGKEITGDDFKKLSEPYSTTSYTEEIEEYNKMKASVGKNKGFYIARYEAGNDGAAAAVSKQGINVYNYVGWGIDKTTVGINGAVYHSRQMYKNSNSVVSTLCYGVQWDAALKFITTKDSEYPEHSTEKGNYTKKILTTGSNNAYAINNIYDMAGNVFEWTMEADIDDYRVVRGGFYDGNGEDFPASGRYYAVPEDGYEDIGFRVALYLK